MQLWDGPCLKTLTREKRAARRTVFYGSVYDQRRVLDAYPDWVIAYEPVTAASIPGFIATGPFVEMFNFQHGCCYLCNKPFSEQRLATKEHVTPKALGGRNAGNLLLACSACNNVKADRPPTKHELRLLDAFNTRDSKRWYKLVMMDHVPKATRTLPPLPPAVAGTIAEPRFRKAIDKRKMR